jgi:hypothetical protein
MFQLDAEIPEEEVKDHIKQYQQCAPSQFAVIKISGACISDTLEEIIGGLCYLQQHNLTPTVCLRLGCVT